MSNTISNNVNRIHANSAFLTKAKNPTKDEFAKIAATKTRDAEAATKPENLQITPDTQTSLIAKDPAKTDGVQPLPAVKVDDATIQPVKPDDTTAVIPGLKPEPKPIAPTTAPEPQNNDIWSWMQNGGLTSFSIEKRTLTATFNQPGSGTTPVPAPGSQTQPFAGLKDLMSWFFGDMTPAAPAPNPQPSIPVSTNPPAPQPAPVQGNGAPGFWMTWDASKFDAKVYNKGEVSIQNAKADLETAGTETTPASPPTEVANDYNWKDMMAMAFGGGNVTTTQNNNSSLTVQMEMRKLTALFGNKAEPANSVVA
ncbi:MAG: hypothetical protein K1X67_22525 [Fimbriimonadaceae bacterium]|nr:hypothetical protein [Fimbriimonadaceae bacterium]